MYKQLVDFIRETYNTDEFIPLHAPKFAGNEKKYLEECIDSTFVSSVGKFVNQFEAMVTNYTGAGYAVAAVNGTSALHIALLLAGVKPKDEVITQPLCFIATANAISYLYAKPVFVDVEKETLGMAPEKLEHFLQHNTKFVNGECINKATGNRIKACVPMHTFGHPCKIDDLLQISQKYNIELIEDAAESLGSLYKSSHTGLTGKIGVLSFNGNKTITTGGGGMIITKDKELAEHAKHITTTAKVPHKWEFVHDEVGYNYRLTNLAAALGCAQMEQLPFFIERKRLLAQKYEQFLADSQLKFVTEPENAKSNFWLNAVICRDFEQRQTLLEYTNENGVMTRPIWKLLNKLPMYENCQTGDLCNAEWLEHHIVNIPSSVI